MNATADVLLIEDDAVLGGAVTQRLMLEGFGVRWTRTASDALSALKRARPDFVLADIRLPDGSGEMVFRQALPFLGTTPIVFATAFADIEQAVRLVRAGADDYLTKPYDLDAVVDRIRLALGERRSEPEAGPECVLPALDRIAGSDLPVLLRGETGVGKEIAARRLHALSPRASQPFVAVNCGAIARELMESQFFGHERGAFTGALSAHVGHFEEAGEGTLFLDEIGELDARLQIALLRVLNDGTFRRVGSRHDAQFRGRLVAATNADLAERIGAGQFRQDLYFRLAVVELVIPPLRDRPAEIEPLATGFAAAAAARMKRATPALDDTARAALLAHAWPGNVRELRNRVERAVALGDGPALAATDLFPEQRLDQPVLGRLADVRQRAELDQIDRALALSGGRVSEAAKVLGISRTTLWKRRRRPDTD